MFYGCSNPIGIEAILQPCQSMDFCCFGDCVGLLMLYVLIYTYHTYASLRVRNEFLLTCLSQTFIEYMLILCVLSGLFVYVSVPVNDSNVLVFDMKSRTSSSTWFRWWTKPTPFAKRWANLLFFRWKSCLVIWWEHIGSSLVKHDFRIWLLQKNSNKPRNAAIPGFK